MKRVEFPIEISDSFISKNQDSFSTYDKENGVMVYEFSENIPESFTKELKSFFETNVVGPNQLVLLNPLFVALNNLQQLKHVKYDPRLSEETENYFINNFPVNLSFDEKEQEYVYEYKPGATEDQINDFQKEFEKALKKQHELSYQDCKDSRKIIGSFNTSLREAKKILKAPYSDVIKKIDLVFNLAKQESDNTKNAIELNFQKAIQIENIKKEEAERKKKEEELRRIEELQRENEEMMNKIKGASSYTDKIKEKEKFQSILNRIRTEILNNIPNYTEVALAEPYSIILNYAYPDLLAELNQDVLDLFTDEEKGSLFNMYLAEKKLWEDAIKREHELKKATRKANEASAKTQPVETQPVKTQPVETSGLSDRETLDVFLSCLDEIYPVFDKMSNIDFSNNKYAPIRDVIVNDSIPKMKDMIVKIKNWSIENSSKL